MEQKAKLLLVASERISGTYATRFHILTEGGKLHIGGRDREMSAKERETILADLIRHRESLLNELNDLFQAEQILRRNEPHRVRPIPSANFSVSQ